MLPTYCWASNKKVFDFSLDNDREPDNNKSFTHASFEREDLPQAFTICTAFMTERWEFYPNAHLFLLRNDNEEIWLSVNMYAAPHQTDFTISVADTNLEVSTETLYYPSQWVRICLSLDSITSALKFVVDGEERFNNILNFGSTPENLNLELGWDGEGREHIGMTTGLNIFSSALASTMMRNLTSDQSEQCGKSGDFLDWDESSDQWHLHSQTQIRYLDSRFVGPCKRALKIQLYSFIDNHWHGDCMDHCVKLGGFSPTVTSYEGWKSLHQEINSTSLDTSLLPPIWLSATEGDVNLNLGELDHWPEGESAREGVWRDYYSGEELDNYTRPWRSDQKDEILGESNNCIYIDPSSLTWREWECFTDKMGCPCKSENPPMIRLRGFCPGTRLEHDRFMNLTSPFHQHNIIGTQSSSSRLNLVRLL